MKKSDLPGGRELLCINTEKVYDWVLNEATFDVRIDDLPLPLNPFTDEQLTCEDIVTESVTCEVTPAEFDPEFDVIGRVNQPFVIDGREVTLQLVSIRKNFTVTIYVDLIPELGGATVEVGSEDFTRCEQVILCAPEDTDIDVTYPEVSCFVCQADCGGVTSTDPGTPLPDELDVTLTVRLCQSIQSTYDVTLEILADFCEPRDIFPFPPCPAPTQPPQCPVVFPNNIGGNTGGNTSTKG